MRPLSSVSSSSFLLAIQLGRGGISGDVGGIKELVHGGDGGAYAIPNVVGFKKSLHVLQSMGAANATERNMATTTALRERQRIDIDIVGILNLR